MEFATATEPKDGEVIDGLGIRWRFKAKPARRDDQLKAAVAAGVSDVTVLGDGLHPLSALFNIEVARFALVELSARLVRRVAPDGVVIDVDDPVRIGGKEASDKALWPLLLSEIHELTSAVAGTAMRAGRLVEEQQGNLAGAST